MTPAPVVALPRGRSGHHSASQLSSVGEIRSPSWGTSRRSMSSRSTPPSPPSSRESWVLGTWCTDSVHPGSPGSISGSCASGAVEAEIPDTNVDAGRSSCPEEPRHGPHPPLAPANQLIPRLNLAVFADSLMEAETPPLRTSSKRPNPRRRPTSKATLDEKKWR